MRIRKAFGNLVWRLLLKYFSHDKETLARMIGSLAVTYLAPKETYIPAFRIWEKIGVHITPVNYYFPIPSTGGLSEKIWLEKSKLTGINMNEDLQLQFLTKIFPAFQEEYNEIPVSFGSPDQFYLSNGMFEGTDALTLYCMIRHFRPNQFIEVGSGYSTLLTANTILKNGSGSLICIDPYPSALIREGFYGLTKLIPKRVEDLEPEFFKTLVANDILFIDSSHIVKIGGDVNFLFLRIIPELNPGVIVHVHDIFFPNEYRRSYVMDRLNFWSEQYLLQAFLSFNNEFEILLCNSFLEERYNDQMMETFPNSNWWGGSSIWFRRKL
jgi:hypothetical protein